MLLQLTSRCPQHSSVPESSRLQWRQAPCRSSRRQSRRSASAAPRETLSGDDLDAWEACSAHVEGLGIEPEKAQLSLEKAFAWRKGYWDAGDKDQPQTPNLEAVSFATQFLQEQGAMTGEELAAAVSKFPYVLGLTEKELTGAVNVMEKQQFVKGKAKEGKLKRNPDALGRNWDCQGDCQGHCARCWVNF